MLSIGVALINILIIGGLFAAGGISLLTYGRKLNRKPEPTPGWLAAKGKVLSVEVGSFPKPGMGMVGYAAVIGYNYDVKGVIYKGGDMVKGPNIGTDPVSAQALADRYPVGTPVTVRYNPKDPREVIIQVDPARGDFYVKAGAVILALTVLFSCSILGFAILMDALVASSILG
jgi:hypothetical protein